MDITSMVPSEWMRHAPCLCSTWRDVASRRRHRWTPCPYLADDLPRKRASHLSPPRGACGPASGSATGPTTTSATRSRRFFFERPSSLFDRLRLAALRPRHRDELLVHVGFDLAVVVPVRESTSRVLESIGERPRCHAIELASRRWRGGHDPAVAETSRDNLLYALHQT